MLHYANFSSRDRSLNHSKLALISGLLADEIEESSVDVLGQVGSLQRTALRFESQPRALPGDGTAAVSDVRKQLIGVHVVLPYPRIGLWSIAFPLDEVVRSPTPWFSGFSPDFAFSTIEDFLDFVLFFSVN